MISTEIQDPVQIYAYSAHEFRSYYMYFQSLSRKKNPDIANAFEIYKNDIKKFIPTMTKAVENFFNPK
jgi:hypothetical protein